MQIEEKTESQTPLSQEMMQLFHDAQKPILVIYGNAPNFQHIVEDFAFGLEKSIAPLYMSIDMQAEKRETPGDTLFEIIHQILDTLLDKVLSTEEQFQLFQIFRMLENLKKQAREYDPEDKLAEFMAFAESVCYPSLAEIFRSREEKCIIELHRLEYVAEWGSKLRNFLVDRLLRRSQEGKLSFVLFFESAEPPSLFYGSNKEGSEKQILFHKLSPSAQRNTEQESEYKDNYRL